jgi:hypothetical protein
MDAIRAACSDLLDELEGKNVPLTINLPERRGVVFIYSGDNWQLFSDAIRQAVDRVQEAVLERGKGP